MSICDCLLPLGCNCAFRKLNHQISKQAKLQLILFSFSNQAVNNHCLSYILWFIFCFLKAKFEIKPQKSYFCRTFIENKTFSELSKMCLH